jgi:hypothetical protein
MSGFAQADFRGYPVPKQLHDPLFQGLRRSGRKPDSRAT